MSVSTYEVVAAQDFTFLTNPRSVGKESIATSSAGGQKAKLPRLALDTLRKSLSGRVAVRFRGRFEIPGFPQMPEQDFIGSTEDSRLTFENEPGESWPRIVISCDWDASSSESKFEKPDFGLHLSDQTPDGWIRHTRVVFALAKADGRLSLNTEEFGRIFDTRADFASELENRTFLQLAKLSRKLKFLEGVFNQRFSIPGIISSDELMNVELVFRGLTEGEFSLRNEELTIMRISPSDLDLSKPPFDGAGPFSYPIGDKLTLLGNELFVGPMTIHLKWAEMAGPSVVNRIRRGLEEPLDVRFTVWDHQVTYRFEKYAGKSGGCLLEEINGFKETLVREEPQELAEMVDESLVNDVSVDEAIQIASGWQYYSGLPDRFSPQEPERDEALAGWRVPIYLVYPSAGSGSVGEVVIHVKTGAIISHTPIDEIRSRGLALAEKLLHA